MFYTQIVFISCILEIFFLYLPSRRLLYRSRPYWRFFSFFYSERFLHRSQAYWRFFLLQEDFGTFHMLFFEAFHCFF